MSTASQHEQPRAVFNRFPKQHREAVAALLAAVPNALELAQTNPPLAVILANAGEWGTFRLAKVNSSFVADLLRQRRKEICAALAVC